MSQPPVVVKTSGVFDLPFERCREGEALAGPITEGPRILDYDTGFGGNFHIVDALGLQSSAVYRRNAGQRPNLDGLTVPVVFAHAAIKPDGFFLLCNPAVLQSRWFASEAATHLSLPPARSPSLAYMSGHRRRVLLHCSGRRRYRHLLTIPGGVVHFDGIRR